MKHAAFSPMLPRQQGVAAVEFAIVLPLLMLILTGMIEYSRLMWHYDALAKATRDAARYLAEEDKPITPAMKNNARSMVADAAAAAGIAGLVPADDVDVDCNPADCVNPNTVTVSVDFGFTIGGWIPVIGPLGSTVTDVTLSPHTTMRYMR
jgi:Flp pilus assembly protein TadG